MRKHFLLLLLITVTFTANAQTARGIRIGYIDMEYILQNVPDFTEAKNQLEQKAQKWKQEIEVKKNEINKLKESLKTERVLLTKELIEEREEEILFQETELTAFQEKRFGPNGDLIVQKAVMVKPIQDQVFTAVQDIAEQKKYDFVLDKSSDLTVLFAAKRFDISDAVIRSLTRSSKRSQLSKKELKEEEIKEYQEDLQDQNSDLAARQKALEDKRTAREKAAADKKAERERLMEERKLAAQEKREAALAKRQQLIDEKNGKKPEASKPEDAKKIGTEPVSEDKQKTSTQESTKVETLEDKQAARKEAVDAKAKELEERKKAIADKKAKILADREAAKKAKEDKKETENKTEENK
ncbi:Skp family chaperone for outer membrane proteins [Flavobacterium arsenatis]|uniref:Skp family chaperone for outer membrane proteins n=1 Tax=Flavobacterium arsenatis TaxID=1484332 RepID=A0ABU1TKS5_9FLAO|nr:OmpH family outer membrane protein [Flavobacterium arsenatis]MDR6966549.1 Skp family chaperone for outer membrane proteins [Flavobacterium arsenatis]